MQDMKTVDDKSLDDKSLLLLIVEDDPDDQLIIREALEGIAFPSQYRFVNDGEELMRFLIPGREKDAGPAHPLPALIILDLNLPKKDGREVLREIKAHPVLRTIPVIVLTTSKSPEDIAHSYDSGANSYIVKPTSYDALLDIMQTFIKYWFDITKLP